MATPTTSSAVTAPSSSRCSRIVFRTTQLLVLLVVLIGAVIGIAWLILDPRPPVFRLDYLYLSGLPNASDVSSPLPQLHVQIQLTATNPNKKLVVVIRDVNLQLALINHGRPLPLSSHNNASSSEYYISKRDRRVLAFEVKAGLRPGHRAREERAFQFTVGEDLRRGSVAMSVSMNVGVKFMHGYWPTKQASVNVACENLSVGLSASRRTGKLKDEGKDCTVGFA